MNILTQASEELILINTFTVEPSRSEELLKILSEATEEVMRHLPGFISVKLHVSTDKRHVANYARWRNMEDIKSMMQTPTAQLHMKMAADLAESFQPIYYALRESIDVEPLV